jgi:hypothetical protein
MKIKEFTRKAELERKRQEMLEKVESPPAVEKA